MQQHIQDTTKRNQHLLLHRHAVVNDNYTIGVHVVRANEIRARTLRQYNLMHESGNRRNWIIPIIILLCHREIET